MNLRGAFDRHGCDRGTARHNYQRVYGRLLASLRELPLHILDVGVLNGAGIAAWLDYFPNALIVGMDTFDRVPLDQVPVMSDPRVSACTGDSRTTFPHGLFDLIFDDGDHSPGAQLATFQNLWPHLSPGGRYFIEDVWALDQFTPKQLKHHWLKSHKNFNKNEYMKLLRALKPYQTKHHDLRAGGAVDSYIIEVRKPEVENE